MSADREQGLNDAVVKRLLDEIAAKDKQIKSLLRWIVVLVGICLALLALGSRHDGPEWSGVSRVDGRN